MGPALGPGVTAAGPGVMAASWFVLLVPGLLAAGALLHGLLPATLFSVMDVARDGMDLAGASRPLAMVLLGVSVGCINGGLPAHFFC